MKSQVALLKQVVADAAIRCCTSHLRDLKTISDRVEHEGLSFLTITLPQFGKDFELSLDRGVVTRDLFQGFSWKGGLPLFLGGFLELVFDRNDGRLLDDPSIDAIQAIRQLTLMASKVFEVSNKRRERAAMDRYVECELELSRLRFELSDNDRSDFRRISNLVFGSLFRKIEDFVSDPMNLIPRHGPGSTADGLSGNQKFFTSWPSRLDQHFSCADFLIPNYSFVDELQDVEILEPGSETPVKVISVPKTQKTPRIIAMEPTAMQYAQQSIQRVLYEFVERDDTLSALIGFLDQTPNQDLARLGSSDGSLATLDLSEASDRVHCLHVEDLFSNYEVLQNLIFACRSSKADVPGHGVITLTKYASMGSALTFPLEAMTFLVLIFLGIERELSRPLTTPDVKSFVGSVRIFGDDIIIPVDYVQSVVDTLSLFGQKVNSTKSFWTGRFRESCGKEYFMGHDVSIVKVRAWLPYNRSDTRGVISAVSLRNLLYKSGYWRATRWLDSLLSGMLKHFPVVEETSPLLGRFSFLGYQAERMCPNLHRPLVKGWQVRAPLPANAVDGYRALLKWFISRGSEPLDVDHLDRSGRPRFVNIKTVWNTPY